VDNLFAIGLDQEILTEAVHAASQTIDSRHFADEFLRRRRLADKGVMAPDSTPPLPSAASTSTGGWNEVAKKGPQTSQEPAQGLNNFKVVAAKKKGRKN
jgi:PERQ amino acid-rich with GYF domain-containing protein